LDALGDDLLFEDDQEPSYLQEVMPMVPTEVKVPGAFEKEGEKPTQISN
jgi:hypothetical protein